MSFTFRNTRTHYGLGGRIPHWISVLLLVLLIVTASEFEEIQDGPEKTALVMQHASWGVLFLFVMTFRLYWRSVNQNPVHSYRIPDAQRFAAVFLHRLIYFTVITQSLIGLCNLYFSGHGIVFFGMFETPALMNDHELLSGVSSRLHFVLSIVIYPLFAMHICAAIYHQLFGVVDHDILD